MLQNDVKSCDEWTCQTIGCTDIYNIFLCISSSCCFWIIKPHKTGRFTVKICFLFVFFVRFNSYFKNSFCRALIDEAYVNLAIFDLSINDKFVAGCRKWLTDVCNGSKACKTYEEALNFLLSKIATYRYQSYYFRFFPIHSRGLDEQIEFMDKIHPRDGVCENIFSSILLFNKIFL